MSDAGSTLVVQKLGLSKKASLIDDSMNNISMATIEEDAEGNQEMEVGQMILTESTRVVEKIDEENDSDH